MYSTYVKNIFCSYLTEREQTVSISGYSLNPHYPSPVRIYPNALLSVLCCFFSTHNHSHRSLVDTLLPTTDERQAQSMMPKQLRSTLLPSNKRKDKNPLIFVIGVPANVLSCVVFFRQGSGSSFVFIIAITFVCCRVLSRLFSVFWE